jgi:diacylglycerol kinase family enzyme
MIRRGEQWGVATTRTSSDVLVHGDRELALSSTETRLILSGGDIAHSLGNPQPPVEGQMCTEVPIDALQVFITFSNGSTRTQIAASHVTVGQWLRGRLICVSNGGFIGTQNVSPRAHPNDGLFDVMSLDSSMGLQQRFKARRKSVLGTHTPHPLIELGRARSIDLSVQTRSEVLRVDGSQIRAWTSVQIDILPDYWRVLV